MTQAGKEYHFEKSFGSEQASEPLSPSRDFAGRRPWGLDAMGADADVSALSFDHGIRRSPAEKLVSRGPSVPLRRAQGGMNAPELRFGDYVYRACAAGGIRLLAYEGADARLEIPARIDGKAVVSLVTNLFRDHTEIEYASMPDTVEHTGNHVFDGCANMRSVRLSSSLCAVDPTMFLGCASLSEVELSAPSVHLENNTFSDAPVAIVAFGAQVRALDALPSALPNLTRIRVDARNERFSTDGRALLSKDCTHVYRLVVPSSSYDVPEGCTVIDERAFDSQFGLSEVGLPDSLVHIERMAFAKTSVSDVRFPASLESVGEKAFFHCSNLARIAIPCGLREVGAEAFAFSAVSDVELPPSLERLGFRAFDHTPAQAQVSGGSLRIASANPHLRLDSCGGLYRHDAFIELIGMVERYRVHPGTRTIADGAFKRHATVREVDVPEGVVSIGCESFRGDRLLERVDLPESLESIGDGAFLDTSLRTLRLSSSVRTIGDGALLIQGSNQLMPRAPLQSLDLDADNPVFYRESGLLCQRDGSKTGGDACLLYVGPDAVVRIPERVTSIAGLAFCGSGGVDELYLHDHLHSICTGAFSTARTIPLVHVRFPEPVDGYDAGDFLVPELSSRYRSPSYLFGAGPSGTVFDFDYYDSWVSHTSDIRQFAPAALQRLMHPMRLSEHMREVYESLLIRKRLPVCRFFAEKGDMESLVWLSAEGLLDQAAIDAELDATVHEGRTQATACLLELKHRLMPEPDIDLSL